MLSWDNDMSVQLQGMQMAQQIKSLWVLILPILPQNSKSIWENCAKVLAAKSDCELFPYLTELFKWFQDMNWPGASIIYDRLLEIDVKEISLPLSICLLTAQNTNDKPWEASLTAFKNHIIQGDG